jgi:hypothetical protein
MSIVGMISPRLPDTLLFCGYLAPDAAASQIEGSDARRDDAWTPRLAYP